MYLVTSWYDEEVIGVFSYDGLKEYFPEMYDQSDLSTDWCEVTCLDIERFSPEEIRDILASEDSYMKWLGNFREDYDDDDGREVVDGQWFNINVIEVTVNKKLSITL